MHDMSNRLRRAHRLAAMMAGLSSVAIMAGASANEPLVHRDRSPAEHTMSGTYQIAQLFGESDEQKAARLQMEQSQNASINYTRQKVQDLESSARRLTGALEEQDHRITELNNRI